MGAWSDAMRAQGKRIAFVPTMGALHDGHLALITAGRQQADVVALSIFVNPTQFGPNEDLEKYPRDLPGDLAKAGGVGADIAFTPGVPDMYPPGAQTFVTVGDVATGLCGDLRPNHFRGVATIVCKLFNIVRPHVAIFGEKDYQQLAVIRRMTSDLDIPVEIVGHPIVREVDGLAMSSRNRYLSPADRLRALGLSQALRAAKSLREGGETDARKLEAAALAVLTPHVDRVDYLEVRDAHSLRPIDDARGPSVILVAAFVGATRLIDNLRIA